MRLQGAQTAHICEGMSPRAPQLKAPAGGVLEAGAVNAGLVAESSTAPPRFAGLAEAHPASAFARDGFFVIRGMVDADLIRDLRQSVLAALDPLMGPVEYEAEVGYPGAPPTVGSEGGRTPRRLLHALSRFPRLVQWAQGAALGEALKACLEGPLLFSQCHHNCVMTKHPGYSSATLWHQDIRYWSFERPELVSVWLALGEENARNGALRIIPGSHRLALDRGRFDRHLFLHTDQAQNKALIRDAREVALAPGDVLFFHCRALHAAGVNRTDEVKLSCVLTCHAADNRPLPGTRSDRYPALPMG